MDYHGITIDRARQNGMYMALVPGAGYVKGDTLQGVKRMIRESWEPVAIIQRFPLIVHLLEVDADTVTAKSGSAWTDSLSSVTRAPIRHYKVYYSPSKDDYYFRIHGQRYWFNEAIRTGTPWG